jgi:CHAD domain-containing protein
MGDGTDGAASSTPSRHPSMNGRPSYDRLWHKRLDALSAVWPDFLGGQTQALHKARVASRRIREALPIVSASASPAKVKKLERRMRDLTRFLGPIRELDVELGLLEDEDGSGDVSRSALAMVRREVASERHTLRHDVEKKPPVADIKKLIKKLERVAEGKGKKEEGKGKKKKAKHEAAWRGVLAARLLRRAKDLSDSLEAAGPLYVPERIHGVRISTKKLRYALEIASETGLPGAAAQVKKLKKHQERLGRLHDLESLLKRVRGAEGSPAVGSHLSDLTAYADVLERRCRKLHADFVEHRDGLIDCIHEVRFELVPALTTASRRQARVSKARRETASAKATDVSRARTR